ncbi:hypothetical protein SLE2022_111250 [Rubroshorea leprosula]
MSNLSFSQINIPKFPIPNRRRLEPSPLHGQRRSKDRHLGRRLCPCSLRESAKSNAVNDYNFCIKSLSCPHAATATNPKALTKVVLQLAKQDAEAIIG